MAYICVFLLIVILSSTVVFYFINQIGPTPSSFKVRIILSNYLPNRLVGDIVEAGAGFGGMACWLAKKYPDNQVIAWENAWLPFVILWSRSIIYHNLMPKYGNFNQQPLDKVSMIYTFLCRKGMQVTYKWLQDTSQNILLLSNAFMLPCKYPLRTIKIGKGVTDNLYFYQI